MGIYREMVLHAENGDRQEDYVLRRMVVDVFRCDHQQMPTELVTFDRRALLRNLAQLEQLTASFRVSTGSGLSRIKGLGWAEG